MAATLRGVGVDFGLDFSHAWRVVADHQNDELSMADAVRDRLLRGNLHPGVFLHWGSGGFYLFGAVDALWIAARAACGTPFRDTLERLADNPSALLLAHRLTSLVAGLLTLWLLHGVVARALSQRVAWVAMLLLAGCYLHVRESHFGSLDVLLGLATLVVIDRCLRHVAGEARQLWLAGLFAGCAAALKYSGALLALLILVAALLRREPLAAAAGPVRRLRATPLPFAIMGATFLLLSPQLVFASGDVWDMLRKQAEVIGFHLGDVPQVVWYHLSHTLWIGFGEVPCMLAALGLVGLLAQPATRPFAILTLLPWVMLLTTRTTAVRYGVPLLPGMAAWAAFAIAALAQPALRWWRARLIVLLCVALFMPLLRAVSFDRLLLGTDTRISVLEALRDESLTRDDALVFGVYGVPRMALSPFLNLAYNNKAWDLERALALRPRYLVVLPADPFRDLGFDPYWEVAHADYELVLDIDPRRDRRQPELPDLLTGTPDFFAPYAAPWQMLRTGPPIQLYQRRAR